MKYIFHQWFRYLEPIDIKKENPKDNPNLDSITGADKIKEKKPLVKRSSGKKRGLKNDQV